LKLEYLACHVLVIEDEPLIADYVADLASMAGATSVAVAISEAKAMEAARATLPAVILSDVDLKSGGTGPVACATIRAEFGSIPVIFITGTPEQCDPCDYAAAILSKPITADHLVCEFRKVAPAPSGA
jgi:CheY-like chemotaxis protein